MRARGTDLGLFLRQTQEKAAAQLRAERAARDRDAGAAWYLLHDSIRDRLCSLAGIPMASSKPYNWLTLKEKQAIVIALREPDVRLLVSEGQRWGLEQMADLPSDYKTGHADGQ